MAEAAQVAKEVESLLAKYARDINCLSDPDRFKKKRALGTLTTALVDAGDVCLTWV